MIKAFFRGLVIGLIFWSISINWIIDAINFYGAGFWKNSAVDIPASSLVKSGHLDTYAYRFDWDELKEINSY